MAGSILIPLKTVFDDKGLKQAQKQFSAFGSTIKGALGAVGLSVGLSSIISGLQDATKAAIDDTKSQALLANQLRNTVGASNEQIASVEASIAIMQRQAAVADDEIRPAFANLVRSTGDVTKATNLTSLALDVAAGTGKDLGTVSLALGKAVNGSTTALIKLAPSIKGAKDPMAALKAEFAGAAQAAANNDPIKQLNILFGEMQEQIGTALLPSLQKFSSWMSGPDGTALIDGLVRAFEGFVDQASLAADGVGYLGEKTAQLAKDANISVEMDNTAKAISGIGAMAIRSINPITALIQGLQLLGMLSKVDPTTKFDPTRPGDPSAGRYAALEAFAKAAGSGTGRGGKGAGKKAATDYVAEFANSLADEMRKQMARIRLANKGLSTDFIESIVGSGSGWNKVYQSIIGQSNTAIGRLQQNFNKTAAGLAEIAKAAEEAAKKVKEANDKLIEDLTKSLETAQGKLADINAELNPAAKSVLEIYQDAKRAYEELTASSAAFAKTIPDVVSGIRNMTQLAEPIGQFEQQVVSSFANVEASLKSALDSKLITDASYADLSAWAKREMSLMQDIARQRDELAKKISLAEAVYNDSKNAILAYGNINGLLKTTSQTITETQTKIVDGITISLTKSVEQVSQNNLVDQYKAILQKTKDFANNLNALKKMGLNKDLFKQIVDAGVETGGATAAAIIQGGQQGVTELNGVFTDLQAVGDQVGETTAVVMFNNGVDVMGGFINGMKAQEASLAATAKTLAATFATAFGDALKTALQIVIDAAKAEMKKALDALNDEKTRLTGEIADLKKELGKVGTVTPPVVDNSGDYIPVSGLGAGAIGFRSGTSLVDGGSKNFYVTVTNPDPNAVVDALKRYTKQNGNILI